MDDFFKNWDSAERLLASGALNLGLGVSGVMEMQAAAALGEVTLGAALGALGVVNAVAITPILLVTGVYALTVSEKEGQGLLDAANQTYQAAKVALRPTEWLEDKVSEYIDMEVEFDQYESPNSKDKTLSEIAKEKGKELILDGAQEISEKLLQKPDTEKSTPSRNNPAGTDSPSHVDGPMDPGGFDMPLGGPLGSPLGGAMAGEPGGGGGGGSHSLDDRSQFEQV